MTWEKWIADTKRYLESTWGLNSVFAESVALLLAYFLSYGLSPHITSGFRSQREQDDLYRRWLAGEPGIYKPSKTVGKHGTTGFLGAKSALAVDIATNNHSYAAQIARALKIGTGLDFNDPVHFFQKD